ncbi:hypothetical protein [Streptomyces sp. NPDC059761]|uniref:hypothetical protein n=1 Tax=Streptomyces sp. NPDC059761 TaxID=3346937 RepID=UPI0036606939
MVTTSVNAFITPLETGTGDGIPTRLNGTTVPTSRSSSKSGTLPTVPRITTAKSTIDAAVRAVRLRVHPRAGDPGRAYANVRTPAPRAADELVRGWR